MSIKSQKTSWEREQVKMKYSASGKDCFFVYVNSIFTDTGFLSLFFFKQTDRDCGKKHSENKHLWE